MVNFQAVQQTVADGNLGKFLSLVDQLPDINASDEHGNTLLHWAVAYKRLQVAQELIEKKKIDTTKQNIQKKTAFDLCVDACVSDISFFEMKTYLKKILGK
ncbi:predicted protein [Naegleria gruberi]|uniref:Predicted protein n=1 Tax=Naegleria gruberi TaxID=5762 RepID=D2VMZ3_NAEGR|nr:uncharacterized protein NAEGRDRAFT_70315 [Naegleria gruberi]EFC41828.1 predicted protein [Naegleria gruberi]|eukprot:XP_002674572.1 predicted protein [Naegleria gruberi strain NEG-M]